MTHPRQKNLPLQNRVAVHNHSPLLDPFPRSHSFQAIQAFCFLAVLRMGPVLDLTQDRSNLILQRSSDRSLTLPAPVPLLLANLTQNHLEKKSYPQQRWKNYLPPLGLLQLQTVWKRILSQCSPYFKRTGSAGYRLDWREICHTCSFTQAKKSEKRTKVEKQQ